MNRFWSAFVKNFAEFHHRGQLWRAARKAKRLSRQERRKALKNARAARLFRLVWVNEATIQQLDNEPHGVVGKPTLIAKRTDGTYRLWPKPDHEFNLWVE